MSYYTSCIKKIQDDVKNCDTKDKALNLIDVFTRMSDSFEKQCLQDYTIENRDKIKDIDIVEGMAMNDAVNLLFKEYIHQLKQRFKLGE